jgi:hypothetical protein
MDIDTDKIDLSQVLPFQFRQDLPVNLMKAVVIETTVEMLMAGLLPVRHATTLLPSIVSSNLFPIRDPRSWSAVPGMWSGPSHVSGSSFLA